MINFNGNISESSTNLLSVNNRGFAYGDALFETLKIVNGRILYWEDHYFRLMASMRILRMDIPMNFTLEFIEEEIVKTLKANNLENNSARVKLTINRKTGGLYDPEKNEVDYLITVNSLNENSYFINEGIYTVDLFKDFFIAPGLLSNIKTNNRILNVVGSIYARENELNNCLILNTNKAVVEGLNANIFLVKGKSIKTPPLDDGCIKGILRKQIIDIINDSSELELNESSISPFELQKADELFLTNVITGIQPISQYRKKKFATTLASSLLDKLNNKINS